jgi:hypothetical protein
MLFAIFGNVISIMVLRYTQYGVRLYLGRELHKSTSEDQPLAQDKTANAYTTQ